MAADNADSCEKLSPDEPPPAYRAYLEGDTVLTDDGRVNVDSRSRLFRTLSRFLSHSEASTQPALPSDQEPPSYVQEYHIAAAASTVHKNWVVRLNIVIQVVGSRGDVQPFVALGTELQKHGHRVRIATHATFAKFVTDAGLEFFPIGGDPIELLAYMVKNPGLIPNMKSLRAGDVQKKRQMMADILDGCWASCVQADPITAVPFVANAIIANPPAFAHVHCAQVLGIPLHLMFTMPWTSTRAFPHPLANLGEPKIDHGTANYVSYAIIEWLTWQGLGDIINAWRSTLDLEPIPLTEGPQLHETLNVPVTYCWSPALLPKPVDWPDHVDVCGFFTRHPPNYTPPDPLRSFLSAGSAPIYVGFGSIVLEQREEIAHVVVRAIQKAGVRAVISKGWSNLASSETGSIQENEQFLYIDDCPHEWLFPQVAAVVHHGGAGTTACGLRFGRPTAIVPFFGDQPFWASMVAACGAGPEPIPFKSLNETNLAAAIRFCLSDEAALAAQAVAEKMANENGVQRAVHSFHSHLPLEALRCSVVEDRPAVWAYRDRDKELRLSAVAAQVLVDSGIIDQVKLKLHKTRETSIVNRRWDPVSATLSSLISTFAGMTISAANIFVKPVLVHRSLSAANSLTQLSDPTTSADPASSAPLRNANDGPHGSGCNLPRGKEITATSKPNVAASMALASAASVGSFFKHHSRGFLVDLPVAFADGARAVPKLYGEDVPDYGPVKDMKSAISVAGKNFVQGTGQGFADLFMKPYEGGKDDGVVGAITGMGKGLLGFSAKTSSALVGVVAYPSSGVYKTIRECFKGKTKKCVQKARREEGLYWSQRLRDLGLDGLEIVRKVNS